MNIAIGTAQFTKNYNLTRKNFSPKSIINYINNSEEITLIDTAPSYGEAEKIIGMYLKKKINITSKINPFKYSAVDKNLDKFKKDLEKTLKNFGIDQIYGILFHKESDILKSRHDKFFYYLENLINKEVICKIGFSTYGTKNIKKNLSVFNFNIIQLPINIFNSSLNYIEFLKDLKKNKKIEIHARSIFLKGLGFENNIDNKKFFKLNEKLEILSKISKNNKISKFKLMLIGIYNRKLINTYIIGVNSVKEMKEINELKKIKKKNYNINFKNFVIEDDYILDPRKWPKKI